MFFGSMPIDEAEGAFLAHSLSLGGKRFKKGHRLSGEDLLLFRDAGRGSVIAARFEPGDVPEDEAARRVARAAAGEGVRRQEPFTGRCNLYAAEHGIALIEAARVDALNAIDEAVTIATVAPFDVVEPEQMLATVKIIPFAAPEAAVTRAEAAAGGETPLIRVAAFRKKAVGLVMTRLAETKPSVLQKTVDVVRARVEAFGSAISASETCAHAAAEVAAAVRRVAATGADPILVFGASATVDRRDEVPAGIAAAGGEILHFGMPVDPGNLLLLARLDGRPVIGLPGCARSPKLNGFDWVLQRLLADVSVRGADIARMGAGGLLKEIVSRPQPRAGGEPVPAPPRAPRIAALVLAAGKSSRMGSNKLMEPVGRKPMLEHTVDAVLASSARPVVVVAGHEASRVRTALRDKPVAIVDNPHYAEGIASSLRAGLAALPAGIDGAIICLGDMPTVRPDQLDRLIAAFNPLEGRGICVPVAEGKRGNPVLFGAAFFQEMRAAKGDVGARPLLAEHADLVVEVAMEDPAVLEDFDTPAALAELRART